MFNYNPKTWFALIFHTYSRQVVSTLFPALVFMGLYSLACCYVMLDVLRLHESDFKPTITMHSLLGIVLGLFLVFRVNSAYDRWWEGRKLWGGLVNNTRNFAHKLNAFLPMTDQTQRLWFVSTIANLVMSLKNHLQGKTSLNDIMPTDPAVEKIVSEGGHVPNKFSSLLYVHVNKLYTSKAITGEQFLLLDRELKEFADIIGACERIKNTPIPYSYAMYIKKFIFIYIITLPFGFVTTSGYITIPMVILISFILLSVELIAEEIENPFGEDLNDLPTHEIALKIRKDVTEILVDADQPARTV
jgi:ion channel-forming bestrophin family protein